mgnify:CR=1 FL=1
MCLLQSFIIFQLIPARGRKRASITTIRILNQISTYPRKGTETTFFDNVVNDKHISTYPRKGTKTALVLSFSLKADYFNLSPQGDENFFGASSKSGQISTYPRKGTETYSPLRKSPWCAFQLIPARGRKHFHLSIEIMMCIISTYPRKGTETALVNHLVPEVLDFNLSPQGDGNYIPQSTMSFSKIFQLIPARGRKLDLRTLVVELDIFQLIPARGQKTPHQKWCGVFLLRALTFRFSWAFSL